jgi:hypothetical protein
MTDARPETNATPRPAGNPWRTFSIILITVLVTLGVGYWLVRVYLFPEAFTPVTLNAREQQQLEHKLERLGIDPSVVRQSPASPGGADKPAAGGPTVEPEPYSEEGASREVEFSEKELNALLARNTDLASKLAIDLSDNLASAKLLIDLDPDMPFFGGNTLNVTAGMELRIADGQPRAILKGVSLWGVPLPNAWLGNLKNVNLLAQFGDAGGFWQAVNEGVETFEITDGKLRVVLKE